MLYILLEGKGERKEKGNEKGNVVGGGGGMLRGGGRGENVKIYESSFLPL